MMFLSEEQQAERSMLAMSLPCLRGVCHCGLEGSFLNPDTIPAASRFLLSTH
ncbi:hypothetical protein LEMLEM_LOCUS10448 [Lemmus lemmus]